MNQPFNSRSTTMSERTELTTTKAPDPSERPTAPAVDIFEDAGGITLLAHMPGVAKDRLDVKLDGDALSVEGRVELQGLTDMRALWAEVNVPRFRRTFTLSRELDASRIEANLKDGVLTLRVPKHAHAQPRRIEVKSA